jgi:hypothetical protein
MEYENLESEVSALHDDLWEQLNLDIQVKKGPQAGGDGMCSVSSLVLLGKGDQSSYLSHFNNLRFKTGRLS